MQRQQKPADVGVRCKTELANDEFTRTYMYKVDLGVLTPRAAGSRRRVRLARTLCVCTKVWRLAARREFWAMMHRFFIRTPLLLHAGIKFSGRVCLGACVCSRGE